MGSAVPLRDDYDAAGLRLLARRTRDASQGRRLLALAAIYGGGSRSDAAGSVQNLSHIFSGDGSVG